MCVERVYEAYLRVQDVCMSAMWRSSAYECCECLLHIRKGIEKSESFFFILITKLPGFLNNGGDVRDSKPDTRAFHTIHTLKRSENVSS